jgi:hypothetical protein
LPRRGPSSPLRQPQDSGSSRPGTSRGKTKLWTALGIPAAIIAIGAIGYEIFVGWTPKPQSAPSQTYVQAGKSLSEFEGQVAQMALDRLGDLPNLGIRPTDAEMPIGTLFIPGRSLDLDEDSCRVDPPPAAYRADAFPDLEVQNAAAASIGLSPAVTRSLVTAGAQIAQGSSVSIHFDTLTRQYLDDNKLAELQNRPACIKALSQGPVSIIRGYFRAQRSFVLATTGSGKLDAKLTKIANFDVSRSADNSSVILKDPTDFGFLQLYTQVALKPERVTSTSTTSTSTSLPDSGPPSGGGPEPRGRFERHSYHRTITGSPPSTSGNTATTVESAVVTASAPAIAGQGRIYIQRDASDSSHKDSAVSAALIHAVFPVVPKVEPIPSAKMPNHAQVRYFNASDLGTATKALTILRTLLPNAELMHIALPSPNGQLEVWLPKA